MSDYIYYNGELYHCDNELYHYGVKGMKWGQHIFGKDDVGGQRRFKTVYGSTNKSASSKNNGNSRDHSKSNKTEGISTAARIVGDILTLNPVGLTRDIVRLGQAGASYVKSKRFGKEREKCVRDKKTGFLLKNKEMTSEEDAARVNPSVKNFDSNTKNNCMLCTSTYELRRRGYEVQAKKASYGYSPNDIKAWYPKAKIEKVSGTNTKDAAAKLKSTIVKQGEGARGNLMITWKNSFGGHSVAYEVKQGKLRIIDTQVNKIYDDPDKFLKRCSPTMQYARLDNVPFNMKNIKEVAE